MSALPDAVGDGPAAVADAVAEGPDAGELVEVAALGGKAGGDGVSVVEDVEGGVDAVAGDDGGERLSHALTLDLGEVGRVFHDAVANDAGDGDADCEDGVMAGGGELDDEVGDEVVELVGGQADEGFRVVWVFGKAEDFACEFLLADGAGETAGDDVFGDDDSDGVGHGRLPDNFSA